MDRYAVLDNPVWNALSSTHAALAETSGAENPLAEAQRVLERMGIAQGPAVDAALQEFMRRRSTTFSTREKDQASETRIVV